MLMKIEKYEKIGNSKYRLYLDTGEVVDTFDEIILEHELLLHPVLTTSVYQEILVGSRIQEQYNACCKYIGFRVRSTKEIIDYLRRRKVDSEDITLIVERLMQGNFLNDSYFCECFIKDKFRFTSMGKYRIIQELKKHQIDDEIIDKYLDLMNDEVSCEKIEKIIEKQIRANHKLDKSKLRNKIYNNLINLGYSSSLIVEVLNKRF